MLIVGSKHSATAPSVALESQIVLRCSVLPYRFVVQVAIPVPYLVGPSAVVLFEGGEGLNDSWVWQKKIGRKGR